MASVVAAYKAIAFFNKTKKVFISYIHSLLYNLHGNHDVELVAATSITRWQLPTQHDGN